MYLHAIKFKGWHVDCIMCLLNMGVDKVILLFLATFHKPRTLFSDVRYKELHVLTNMVIIIALFELYLSYFTCYCIKVVVGVEAIDSICN
jgi:hypothetical protein